MMRGLFFLLLLALYSNSIFAETNNCVFVVMGGSKNWLSLFPMEKTDLSINVDAEIKKEAYKSGCRVISMANDDEATFLKKISQLSSEKPGTSFHLAFTDHGAPAGKNVRDSALITGLGEHTTYGKFMDTLKAAIPKGSHITFQTNSCWPNITEAIVASKLESHFKICGGSSTVSEQMSWNLPHLRENYEGRLVGPYGAAGLHFANQFKKKYKRAPSMAEFHYHAKKADFGNIGKQPGLISSASYAHKTLLQKKQKSPLLPVDIGKVLSGISWKDDSALEKFLNSSNADLTRATQSHLNGTCAVYGKNPFDDFIKQIAPVYTQLVNSNFADLPTPYRNESLSAKNWLIKNQKKFTAILSQIAREKAEFVQKNKIFPREKYPKIEEDWEEMNRLHAKLLYDYQFNLRILQEGKVVQNFLNTASTEEKNRFSKFIDCESKPMF